MVIGQVVLGRGEAGGRWKRAVLSVETVQPILETVFCDGIPADAIVQGSCKIQISTISPSGVVDFLLAFEMLDATALDQGLKDINDNIATNPAITVGGFTATSGKIGGFS